MRALSFSRALPKPIISQPNDGFRKKRRVKTRFFCSTHPTRGGALSLRHGASEGVPELIDGAGARAIAPDDIVRCRLRQWPAAWQTWPKIRKPKPFHSSPGRQLCAGIIGA